MTKQLKTMTTKKEIWKDIKGYENIYQVSNFGRVKTLRRLICSPTGNYYSKEKIMTTIPNDGIGYVRIHLYKNSRGTPKRIHRLVAEAFIPNPENKKDVNHKNGIKCDNRVENLEWATRSENELHAIRFLGKKPFSKKVLCVETGQSFESIKKAAEFFNTTTHCISRVLTKKRKTHKKKHWIYL